MKQWVKNYHNVNGAFGDKPEAKKGLLTQCEEAIALFLSYKKQGLPDEDAKLAVLDELTLRFGMIDLSKNSEQS